MGGPTDASTHPAHISPLVHCMLDACCRGTARGPESPPAPATSWSPICGIDLACVNTSPLLVLTAWLLLLPDSWDGADGGAGALWKEALKEM
jgi:hypothetical protein